MSELKEDDIVTIKNLIMELDDNVMDGQGPFLAAIYDENYNLISKSRNTVIKSNSSLAHAEINTISLAQKKLNTYNLSPYNLGIYITAEPCMMCLGAIMWSGIKRIYFSVSSDIVEKLTGFNEGYKPDWIKHFKSMGYEIHPYILPQDGMKVIKKYVKRNGIIYKPD